MSSTATIELTQVVVTCIPRKQGLKQAWVVSFDSAESAAAYVGTVMHAPRKQVQAIKTDAHHRVWHGRCDNEEIDGLTSVLRLPFRIECLGNKT